MMGKEAGIEAGELICPLLSISEAIWYDCVGARCAWYDYDAEECAIWALARLAQAVHGHVNSEQYPPAILTRSE